MDNVPVLVVDDSEMDRRIVAAVASSTGAKVVTAVDGRDAMEKFFKHRPRIVITDVSMPNVDGIELTRMIREAESVYTYIIVISADADTDLAIEALSGGADDALQKPVHRDLMMARLAAAQRMLRVEISDAILVAVAKLSDCRSVETGKHLDRVMEFTGLLAQACVGNGYGGVTPADAQNIQSFSALHDIGKVAIPDSILNKPGKLTEDEFEEMKAHTTAGGDVLSDIMDTMPTPSLKTAHDIVLYHHEKFDGSGYPFGLSGEDIPVAARIVAVADVYDALSNPRCYKRAYSREECRDIIVGSSGSHFDPALVDMFIGLEDEFWQVRQRLNDD